MRIFGSNATARAASAPAARRSETGGFVIAETDSLRSTQAPASLRTIGGIDALIALQGQDDPVARRRRAVSHGRTALDVLDELRDEVLSGMLAPATVSRLRSAAAGLRDGSGDAGLDAVLGQIELRLEVEIAKLTGRSQPPLARKS